MPPSNKQPVRPVHSIRTGATETETDTDTVVFSRRGFCPKYARAPTTVQCTPGRYSHTIRNYHKINHFQLNSFARAMSKLNIVNTGSVVKARGTQLIKVFLLFFPV